MTIDELIEKWWGRRGGAETSNLHLFIGDLCDALDLPHPKPATAGRLGEYEYEAGIPGGSFRSLKASGRIDLYKRGCFVLEAKQSQLREGRQSDLDLLEPSDAAPRAPSGARYDKLMRDARAQAEHYAKNLPGDQPPAPFIIVCDIGRAFEIEFDYTGNGRGYGFFPDKQRYRIELPALASDEPVKGVDVGAADMLRAIWTDPDSINPRLHAADVTTGVARRLAAVSQFLEESNRHRARDKGKPELESQAIEETSLFLMRIIFCMFAENVGLLPERQFEAFLEDTIDNQDRFQHGLADLWATMNTPGGGFAWAVNAQVQYYNGGLFESNTTYVIGNADRGELYQAARANWKKVEPAIFGTLLEQALTRAERAKLGAHYTPRPYVERLVQATIMDVLESEWAEVQDRIANAADADAQAHATAFHDSLARLRILDPACGTGNFLYVAMEALQQLETKVIEMIETLGGSAEPRVAPHQFHGLELNPRAAKIAELVLWIGWLRFRIANDPEDIPDPVLKSAANINFGRPGAYDAVLAQTEFGAPDLENPRLPAWPEADFIIGNPPFIGKGAGMRSALGNDYVEALWDANPRVPKSADFVMHWWDRAAHQLVAPGTPLRRFGFVTTNSITQDFNRRVIASYLNPPRHGEGDHAQHGGGGRIPDAARAASPPPSRASRAPPPRTGEDFLSLIYAIPDHPWTKATKDSAAVRIAMTVAEAGMHDGCLVEVTKATKLDSDEAEIKLAETEAVIHSDLSAGADITATTVLLANQGLSSNGMMLAGQGFKLEKSEALHLLEKNPADATVIKPYVGGGELLRGSKGRFVIDFFDMTEKAARVQHQAPYQILLERVYPDRKKNRRESFRKRWWVFGEPRKTFRPSLKALNRYIVTTETSKYRVFQFLETKVVPDHMVIAIGSEDGFHLGVLQSSMHTEWALRAGGWLGVGNDSRYSKSKTFDPFPFPDATREQRAAIADLAEELDATRKAALAEVPKLTMTELYNLRDKLRSGADMTRADSDRAVAARAGIVDRLHEQIDAAVADAYGWADEWAAGTLPPSEIVARLVALNAERAAEEEAGTIRWLRPDYQAPRFDPGAG